VGSDRADAPVKDEGLLGMWSPTSERRGLAARTLIGPYKETSGYRGAQCYSNNE
jgi:hypothetical protein